MRQVKKVRSRQTPLRRGGWLFFLVCSVCLAISACYEFVEWFAAVIGGSGATEFLGTQGDVWDTQWDMLMALIGSIVAQALLGGIHDRQISVVAGAGNPELTPRRAGRTMAT